ncbi:hypothetical protein [Nitrospira sp. Ecomares 2.1]
MELTIFVLWTVVALLGYQLWVLWKAHGSFLQILKELPDRIRSGLGVVGVRELKDIQESFYRLEQRDHIRKIPETTGEKFDQHFQECFQKVDSPVDCLEPIDDSLSVMDGPVPRSRSIMWKGLRFTLSDSIWFHAGVVSNEDVEDDQVQAMVQGPFCRRCLKRLVGRVRVQDSGVPPQCHNCGLSWSIHELDYTEMPLGDLKRMVYGMLDRKVRMSRNVQCEVFIVGEEDSGAVQ